MRGDSVFHVYGVHEGRSEDSYFGTFRVRDDAQAHIAKLDSRVMHGQNWAQRYHDRGFVIREHLVSTDFEIPPRPIPRESYVVRTSPKANEPGTWDSTIVEVSRRRGHGQLEPICAYERDHAMFQTFEPFRQGERELALISRHYTKTAVLDLASGEVIAEESEDTPGGGFCPAGFYVPDWWDVNDGSVIPGSPYWDRDREWPIGDFGFVWGCYWGDDSSWKIHYLDLSQVQDGVIARDQRFGHVEIAANGYMSPCLIVDLEDGQRDVPRRPHFIGLSRHADKARVQLSVQLDFDLTSGDRRLPD